MPFRVFAPKPPPPPRGSTKPKPDAVDPLKAIAADAHRCGQVYCTIDHLEEQLGYPAGSQPLADAIDEWCDQNDLAWDQVDAVSVQLKSARVVPTAGQSTEVLASTP